MEEPTTIRPAREGDCESIARLFRMSSGGVADYIWCRMRGIGEHPLAVGARRYARRGVAFSYQNCTVVEGAGRVVGMIHAFPAEPHADAEDETDPVLRPYSELEDAGSLYISGVALEPEYRGRGIGERLLARACERARAEGLDRVSLICFERNAAAMRLYERLGWRAVDRRPIVRHPALHYHDGDAVLMVRAVG